MDKSIEIIIDIFLRGEGGQRIHIERIGEHKNVRGVLSLFTFGKVHEMETYLSCFVHKEGFEKNLDLRIRGL